MSNKFQIVHNQYEPFDIYIGRRNDTYELPESKWANPWIIGKHGTREDVIAKYAQWLPTQKHLMNDLHELDNKILGCWCNYPQQDCHGRVLLEARQKQIYEQKALEKKYKLAVVGSRTFDDKERLFTLLDKNRDKIEMIVSGGAEGADSLAQLWCKERGVPCLVFYANWRPKEKGGELDKGAGFKRNWLICREADVVLALWDGVSKGTQHNFEICKALKKHIQIIQFTPKPKPPVAESGQPAPKKRGRPKKKTEESAVPTQAAENTPVVQNAPAYDESNVDL